LDAKIMPSQGRGTDPVAWACEKGLAVTLGSPLVRVRFAGCHVPGDPGEHMRGASG
jgi:hypothetical protein